MESHSLDELQRLCHLAKENYLLYEALYEEKKKAQEIELENVELKKHIKELDNELKKKEKVNKILSRPEADGKAKGKLEQSNSVVEEEKLQKHTNEKNETCKVLLISHESGKSSDSKVKKMAGQIYESCAKAIKKMFFESVEKCSSWWKKIGDRICNTFNWLRLKAAEYFFWKPSSRGDGLSAEPTGLLVYTNSYSGRARQLGFA